MTRLVEGRLLGVVDEILVGFVVRLREPSLVTICKVGLDRHVADRQVAVRFGASALEQFALAPFVVAAVVLRDVGVAAGGRRDVEALAALHRRVEFLRIDCVVTEFRELVTERHPGADVEHDAIVLAIDLANDAHARRLDHTSGFFGLLVPRVVPRLLRAAERDPNHEPAALDFLDTVVWRLGHAGVDRGADGDDGSAVVERPILARKGARRGHELLDAVLFEPGSLDLDLDAERVLRIEIVGEAFIPLTERAQPNGRSGAAHRADLCVSVPLDVQLLDALVRRPLPIVAAPVLFVVETESGGKFRVHRKLRADEQAVLRVRIVRVRNPVPAALQLHALAGGSGGTARRRHAQLDLRRILVRKRRQTGGCRDAHRGTLVVAHAYRGLGAALVLIGEVGRL